MSERRSITIEQYRAEAVAQGVARNHYASKCPICGTIQSMASMVAVGVAEDRVENVWGFSCVGRFMNAGEYRGERGQGHPRGCNWTLGGLLHIHELEVVTPDGEKHMRFELATPEEAQLLASTLEAASI